MAPARPHAPSRRAQGRRRPGPAHHRGRMPRSRMAAKKRERHVEPPFGPTCPRSSPTSRGTYEHEVREVDAGNEKYERDRAQQQEHSRAHASCHELAQGLDLCDAVREPSRCLGGKRSRDLIHPGLRLLDGHPIAQSTDDVQVAACHVNRAWRATSAPHVSGPKATRSKNSWRNSVLRSSVPTLI